MHKWALLLTTRFRNKKICHNIDLPRSYQYRLPYIVQEKSVEVAKECTMVSCMISKNFAAKEVTPVATMDPVLVIGTAASCAQLLV